MSSSKNKPSFSEAIATMRKLRSEQGCPWNRKQDIQSLKKFLLEEAYETLEVLEQLSSIEVHPKNLCDELGDLLYQILFLGAIAEEKKWFTIEDIAQGLNQKLIRRHPHVFGFESEKLRESIPVELRDPKTTQEVAALWERVKIFEKQSKNPLSVTPIPVSALSGVPLTMPALDRAQTVGQKAAAIGFDWQELGGVLDKLTEEIQEFQEVLKKTPWKKEEKSPHQKELIHEMGDILFTLCNISRFLGFRSESALHRCIERFQKRFAKLEENLQSCDFSQVSIEELEDLWQKAKTEVKDSS